MAGTDWPVDLRGITETVVATLGPNDRWNLAALGVRAPADDAPATARTWGNTRTRRNFEARGGGYVQFTRDPETFARAALAAVERDDPIHERADAWARVEVDRIARGREGGTDWADWHLVPVEAAVERRVVPTTNRGHNAVVAATVAASRLDVAGYDHDELTARLEHCFDVIETCGGPAERRAGDVIRDAIDR